MVWELPVVVELALRVGVFGTFVGHGWIAAWKVRLALLRSTPTTTSAHYPPPLCSWEHHSWSLEVGLSS